MTAIRLRALSWFGAVVVVACGSSGGGTSAGTRGDATSSAGGFGGHGGAGGVSISSSTAASSTGGTATGGAATSTGGAATGGAATGTGGLEGADAGGVDSGPVSDAGSGDAAPPCKPVRIGIFGNPGPNPSSNFQQWLATSGAGAQRLQTTPSVLVVAATLQPFDVVVLDWLTRDYTAAEASAFAAFVSAGGGVVSMSGYTNDPTNDWHANSLLAPLQVAYTGSVLDGPVTSFAPHPITAGLTSVTFTGGYAITDLGGTASTRAPIAFLPRDAGTGTASVGYAIQMGSGRAFIWGDEWIEDDSQWSTIPAIKQLWVQVFTWIASANACPLMPPP